MIVTIQQENYELLINYKDEQQHRNSFNELTLQTYNFDFEDWYQAGYWTESYIPYSLIKDDRIVANASVNVIDFEISGEKMRCIQIGTVMTADAFRNRGLSRYLMEHIMNEWESRCDLIYLFANDTVLDFYPKFGFFPIREYEYSKSWNGQPSEQHALRKLDMRQDTDRRLLEQAINTSTTHSRIAMLGNHGLIMFYCTSFRSDQVFYLPEHNTVVIAEYEGDTCHLLDIFCPHDIAIDRILPTLLNDSIKKVVFGFTPVDGGDYDVQLLDNADEVLFVRPDLAEMFQQQKLRFPVLSHA
jgi:GNAT superfamily N-acetyltransferase